MCTYWSYPTNAPKIYPENHGSDWLYYLSHYILHRFIWWLYWSFTFTFPSIVCVFIIYLWPEKKQIWSMQDTTQYMLGCSQLLLKNITIVVCFCGCRFCPIQFTFDKTQQPMSHRLPWICYRYCRTKGVSLQTSIQPCSGNIRNTRLFFFIKVHHYVC